MRGIYRLWCKGQLAEIELVERDSLARSIIYAGPGQAEYVIVPAGIYHLYVRQVIRTGADIYLRLAALNWREKLSLYAHKIAGRIMRGEIRSLLATIKGRLGRSRQRVSGAKLGEPIASKNLSAAGQGDTRAAIASVDVPADMKFVSIIIPTKERFDLLKACIDSLSLVSGVEVEIIIVDNGATRPEMLSYLASLSGREDITVLNCDIPFNFSRLCNAGAHIAQAPVLLFLNDDIEALDGGWLHAMLGYLAREDTGVVGARLLYPSGDLQHAGIATHLVPGPGHPWLGAPRHAWELNPLVMQSGEVDAVTAACLMIEKSLFDEVGGFDEEAFAITVNDVDLCLRVRDKGLKVIYAAEACLIHKEGQTRRADDQSGEVSRRNAELKIFVKRHEAYARDSVFYPGTLRRDTDTGIQIFEFKS